MRARFPVRVWRDDAVHARLAALFFPSFLPRRVAPPIRRLSFSSETTDARARVPLARRQRRADRAVGASAGFPHVSTRRAHRATDVFARSDPALTLRPPRSLVLVII